jgi:hypothetical protein
LGMEINFLKIIYSLGFCFFWGQTQIMSAAQRRQGKWVWEAFGWLRRRGGKSKKACGEVGLGKVGRRDEWVQKELLRCLSMVQAQPFGHPWP